MNRHFRRALAKQAQKQKDRMGLTKYLKQWVDDETTPGERICFKKPNWVEVEDARAERRRFTWTQMRETREVVGKEILDEWRQIAADDAAKAEPATTAVAVVKTAEEELAEYDRLILLRTGIAAWTYCEPLLDQDGNPLVDDRGNPIPDRTKPIKVTIDAIRDLDDATATWAGLTLIALIRSGFRPVMPEVTRSDDGVIEVRPGVDSDPLPSSSSYIDISPERSISGDESTARHLNTFSVVS